MTTVVATEQKKTLRSTLDTGLNALAALEAQIAAPEKRADTPEITTLLDNLVVAEGAAHSAGMLDESLDDNKSHPVTRKVMLAAGKPKLRLKKLQDA
ncbi:hypothetical protein [Seinonella peptonophila]|uniref:hypothetical protein n=1 Tax=Seinonella peptonophila TaxID=112248 RepID=UPI00093408D9|nr:hypothetical protein [Seinonella peptonophila]